MPINLQVKNYTILGTNLKELKDIVREIFSEHSYYFENENQQPMIIDAGAHVGVATHYFKHYFPQSKIIAIEPQRAAFQLLEENIAQNRLEQVTAVEAALAVTNDLQTIYVDNEEDWLSTTSFSYGAWDSSQETFATEVEAVTLEEVLFLAKELYGATTIDLLKIDIEGAEMDVLTNNQAALKKVKQCIVEFHPSKKNNLQILLSHMKKTGFKLASEVNKSVKKKDQLQLLHFVKE